MKKWNEKGFTLAELLIVVAIIAVLVAIAIPLFNGQLEKSRDTTDAANFRAAYAEAQIRIMEDPTKVTDGSIDVEGYTVQSADDSWGAQDPCPALGMEAGACTKEPGGTKITFTLEDGDIASAVWE